jgi:hypothetical protein
MKPTHRVPKGMQRITTNLVLMDVAPEPARTWAKTVVDAVLAQMERKTGSVKGCLYISEYCVDRNSIDD